MKNCHKKSSLLLLLGACALVLALYAPGTSQAQEPADEKAATEECLSCHGPFEDLIEATKDYKDEWDTPVNPHIYVDATKGNPHDSKEVPSCMKCHETHEVPPPADMVVKKANLKYCYNCHHDETFQPCSSEGCHAH